MRRRSFLAPLTALALAPLLGGLVAGQPARAGESPAPETLVGTWTVDLRPTPTSAPYFKKLVITSAADGTLEGNFYDGSPLRFGRTNVKSSETLCFAFCTDPGEGEYCTSGRMVAPDRLEGMTLSTSRGFLLPWRAVRGTGDNH